MFADHIGNLTVELVLASAEVTFQSELSTNLREVFTQTIDDPILDATVFSMLEAPTNT